MLNTVEIFFSLLLGLTISFSSNLMANDFITLEDGRKFEITEALGDSKHGIMGGFIGGAGGVSIHVKTYTQSIEDRCAWYVGKSASIEAEEIDVMCGNTVHKLEKLKPGYYLRDGEELIYKELTEEDL